MGANTTARNGQAGARTAEVRDRAEDLLHRAGELSGRARERAEDLLHEAEAAIPPARQRAELGLWQGIQGLLSVVAVLPRLLFRLLHLLGNTAETMFTQAEDLSERGQKLARRLPEPRVLRRRHRRQLVLWTAGGFVIGAGVGYVLAQRQRAQEQLDSWNGQADEAAAATPQATAASSVE